MVHRAINYNVVITVDVKLLLSKCIDNGKELSEFENELMHIGVTPNSHVGFGCNYFYSILTGFMKYHFPQYRELFGKIPSANELIREVLSKEDKDLIGKVIERYFSEGIAFFDIFEMCLRIDDPHDLLGLLQLDKMFYDLACCDHLKANGEMRYILKNFEELKAKYRIEDMEYIAIHDDFCPPNEMLIEKINEQTTGPFQISGGSKGSFFRVGPFEYRHRVDESEGCLRIKSKHIDNIIDSRRFISTHDFVLDLDRTIDGSK